MKQLLVVLTILISTISVSAQNQNAIYYETLGSGIGRSSLNYHHSFGSDIAGFGAKVGIGIPNFDKLTEGELFIPVHINYTVGGRHGLELAGGATYLTETNRVIPSSSIMYKYSGKYLLIRAGLAQNYDFSDSGDGSHLGLLPILFWPGVSAGIRF